jgi:hypothetical protein
MSDLSKTGFVLMLFGAAVISGFLMRNQEGFMQQEVGMPLNGPPMGPYDMAGEGWMASEHMPVGHTPQNKSIEENKLMFLVGNDVNHSCCPATFTTDTGCVCLTHENREFMARRGGNK